MWFGQSLSFLFVGVSSSLIVYPTFASLSFSLSLHIDLDTTILNQYTSLTTRILPSILFTSIQPPRLPHNIYTANNIFLLVFLLFACSLKPLYNFLLVYICSSHSFRVFPVVLLVLLLLLSFLVTSINFCFVLEPTFPLILAQQTC